MARDIRPVVTAAAGLLKPFERKATLQRPADAAPYAAGDLIAGFTTAASVVPIVFEGVGRAAGDALVNRSILVQTLRIIAIGSSAPAIRPRVRLYGVAPFTTGAYPPDNGVLVGVTGQLTQAALEAEQILGEVSAWTAASSSRAYADIVPAAPLPIITDEGGDLYALLEAVNAGTPTSGLQYSLVLRGLH